MLYKIVSECKYFISFTFFNPEVGVKSSDKNKMGKVTKRDTQREIGMQDLH